MKVYLPDSHILDAGGIRTGINNAAFRTMEALNRLSTEVSWHVLSRHDLRGKPRDSGIEEHRLGVIIEPVSWPSRFKKLWRAVVEPRLLVRRADVVWGPGLEVGLADARSVINIHDLTAILFPELVNPAWLRPKRIAKLRKSAVSCGAIITHTGYIRKQVIREFTLNREKVFCISLAAYHKPASERQKDCEEILRKLGLQRPYLLWVGTIEPRKNIGRLLDAYGLACKEKPFSLLLIGSLGWESKELISRFDSREFRGKVAAAGYLPEADVCKLYAGAEAFVFPSLYEGFGMPLVEAMEFALPIASSNTSAMPEVAGCAAIYFDPYNVSEMSESIERVMFDQPLRKNLIAAGLKRKQDFSWEKTARETLEVFKLVSRK